jgi:hypothetical protein
MMTKTQGKTSCIGVGHEEVGISAEFDLAEELQQIKISYH